MSYLQNLLTNPLRERRRNTRKNDHQNKNFSAAELAQGAM